MWAWFGLPSIFASVKSQQTLPVAALSLTSTLPLFVLGAPSALPFRVASSLVVAVVVALAANTATSETTTTATPITALRMCLLLLISVRGIRRRCADGSLGDEVRFEHPLDARGAGAALEPLDDALALDERDRRDRLHAEALGQLGLLVDVDRGHAQPCPFLAGEVSHQALHSPRRARMGGAEKDQQGTGIFSHRDSLFPANGDFKPRRRPASRLSARCGRRTGSECRSGSGSGSAGCSRRCSPHA